MDGWPWHLEYSTCILGKGEEKETNRHTEPLKATNRIAALKEARKIWKKKLQKSTLKNGFYNAWVVYKEPLGETTHKKSK